MVIYMDRSQSCKWIQRDMQSFSMNLIAWLGSQHKHGTIIQTFYILWNIKEINKILNEQKWTKVSKAGLTYIIVSHNSLKKVLQ